MRNGLKGAIAHGYRYVLIAICLIVIQQPTVSSEEIVNYEKNDCDRLYIVNDIDVYRLESYPRQGINTGRDKCFNKFSAPNKKLKIHVYEVSIGSCGIFVNIYDGDEKMFNDPRWSLGCRSPGKTVYESFSSEVIVRLDKPVADSSSLYQFRIYITNENGPEVDLSKPTMSDGGGASSGVIAGIGIGVGLVVVVIIVVVAIVCWRMMGKKEKYGNKSPAVFTTSETRGGDSVHFENTLGGSRSRAARASSDRSSTTNGYRSTSGSQRGRSSHNHDNNGYVSSNESSVTNKKVSRNPIPIKSLDGAKFEKATETTTHRFTKRDGSVRKKVNLDNDIETKQHIKKERPKDETDSARVGLIQKSKPNDNTHSLIRSSSEKRNTGLRSTIGSRADTSSDTLSSHSDRRSRRDDRQSGRSHDDRNEKRSKDSATRRSSYRESQSHDRRDRIGSTRSRNNSTSRSNRPAYKDEYDTGWYRSRQSLRYTSRHQEKNYSDYDSDHRSQRREKYDRNPGYDSDARRRHHDYDSDRGGRDRGYDSETRRRHRDYDSDRGGRDRSQRRHDQDQRDKYYSDEDLVESRRQRGGSLSRKSRPRSQSYSRDSRR
ncbi:pre-mRNA-splicing factor CWC22 homolog isoform X1 [Mizuhopecten yessoensis]|uniref:CUB domain-containing protein n=1 Tax=Mizuhopecten yessoensis TaxID=6573 RepID=A0A210R5R0_MIZYE|nr:pre-mRNA-splicing factor CWC22 homolog isoform X1 [Mizuhopecten yessoensis]OWF56228.1 hypothetical protein KP79_PYT12008 [Mizuhopecten yessoensis]